MNMLLKVKKNILYTVNNKILHKITQFTQQCGQEMAFIGWQAQKIDLACFFRAYFFRIKIFYLIFYNL